MKLKEFHRPRISLTRTLKIPNEYTLALDNELREFAFNEERAPLNQGKWRSEIFGVPADKPMDLEVGTGNGTFFQHRCLNHPERLLVGVELKYKPLIQTIRGALRKECRNGRVMRIHAFNVDTVFAAGEIDDVYIHFPDPWTSPRKPKNRMLNQRMLGIFWELQRPGSFLNFKTDSMEMFDWTLEQIQELQGTKYRLLRSTRDLHKDPEFTATNFITQF